MNEILIILFTLSLLVSSILLGVRVFRQSRYIKTLQIDKDSAVINNLSLSEELDRERIKTESAQNEQLIVEKDAKITTLKNELFQLNMAINESNTIVLIANTDGVLTWANAFFTKKLDFTLNEFKTKRGASILELSSNNPQESEVFKAMQKRESFGIIKTIHAKDGTPLCFRVLVTPVFDSFDNVKQFIITANDITELTRINNKLSKIELVTGTSPNTAILYDRDGKLDWVNGGLTLMYSYSVEEFISIYGNSFDEYCAMNFKPELYNNLKIKKETLSFVGNYTCKNKQVRWKQVVVTPILTEDNELDQIIVIESDITTLKMVEQEMEEEKNRVDTLLRNILPEETTEELKSKGFATPRFYRKATVLFADIQNFTKLSENLTPVELVEVLQTYFTRFDSVVAESFVEKIKTVGDAMLCVGGIPMKNNSHPFDTVLVGLNLQRIMSEIAKDFINLGKTPLNLRVGIHTGPLVAGVVGKDKMTYDIWGDSVNIAKRIESACVPGMVNVSESTYEYVKDYFETEPRGKLLAKHKGHIEMYFIHRLKPEFSSDTDGLIPNSYFQEMLARL